MRTMLLILAMLVLAGPLGAQTIVFQNDFNHDTVGAEPGGTPPLEPADDEFRYLHRTDAAVVETSVGDMTDQPLVLTQPPGQGSMWSQCLLSPGLQDCETYTVSWRWMLRSATTFVISADARGPSGELMASISWRMGTVVFNAGGINETDLSTTWSPDFSRTFDMTLDMIQHTVSLSADGVPLAEVQGASFRQVANSFKSWNINFGGAGPQVLVLDDIRITASGATCGQVPVETTSWSAIKGRW